LRHSVTEPVFLQHATRIAARLRSAFRELLAITDDPRSRPPPSSELRTIHPTLRSRLLRALESTNDLTTLYHLPGPDGLRRVIRAARKANRSGQAAERCEACVAEYERFLAAEEADRDKLHAVLGGFLPEARDAVVRASGQAAFKAMSNLIGYYADLMLFSMVVFPGTAPDRCHVLLVRGFEGWRRLRQEVWPLIVGYGGEPQALGGQHIRATDLQGQPLDQRDGPVLLEPFCSRPVPEFRLYSQQHMGRQYQLAGHEVGTASACTFYLAELHWNVERRYRSAEQSVCLESVVIVTPSKHLLFDVLVHRDVWTDVHPAVECYRVVPHGPVTERSRSWRRFDRIDLPIAPRALGLGLHAIDSTQSPKYGQVVDYVLREARLARSDFVGYRCETPFPIYASQVGMRFDLPEPPADADPSPNTTP